MAHQLTPDLAAGLARIALGHVTREYPNKPGHVLAGPDDARTPAALHPAFYGSFDWHSCVHSYWLLARVLRRFAEGITWASIGWRLTSCSRSTKWEKKKHERHVPRHSRHQGRRQGRALDRVREP